MNKLFTNPAVLAALSAIIATIITAILSPYIKWGREKKKIIFSERKGLINRCRETLSEFDVDHFICSPIYSRLEPYINDQLHDIIEKSKKTAIDQDEHLRKLIKNELKRLEKKWKLL